jgi:hypothetical protein
MRTGKTPFVTGIQTSGQNRLDPPKSNALLLYRKGLRPLRQPDSDKYLSRPALWQAGKRRAMRTGTVPRSFTSSRSGAIRGRVRFSGETLPVQIPRHEPTLPSHVRFVEVARRPNVFALVQHLGPSYPTRPTFDMSGRRRLAGGCPLDGRVRCPVTVHVSGVPVS